MAYALRAGRPNDAEAAGRICFEAFEHIARSHRFPPDFPHEEVAIGLLQGLLSDATVYSVVAEREDRVVGSNFLWEKSSIAGVGPITVSPSVQDSQVGRALMNDVLDRSRRRGFAGVRLVQAAYHNRSLALYTKLGFEPREPLSTVQGTGLARELEGYRVRPARAEDVDTCNALCMRVHGVERSLELEDAIRQGTASVVERSGRITGYATLIGFFGHAVAETNDDMKALIASVPRFEGPGFLLPTRNGELLRWCLECGLRIVQPMTLMSIGLYNEPKGAYLPSVLY